MKVCPRSKNVLASTHFAGSPLKSGLSTQPCVPASAFSSAVTWSCCCSCSCSAIVCSLFLNHREDVAGIDKSILQPIFRAEGHMAGELCYQHNVPWQGSRRLLILPRLTPNLHNRCLLLQQELSIPDRSRDGDESVSLLRFLIGPNQYGVFLKPKAPWVAVLQRVCRHLSLREKLSNPNLKWL